MTAAPQIPTFDPESPDAAMVGAYAQVRRLKTEYYQHDRRDDWPDEETADASLATIEEAEDAVCGCHAQTVSGVIARLMLLVPAIDTTRWIDEALVEHGPLALAQDWDGVDGNAQQAQIAAVELVRIEWLQALATYEHSAADFGFALKIKNVVDTERKTPAGGKFAEFHAKMLEIADEAEDRFSNGKQILSLVRTLAPDLPAFMRKVDIVIAEGVESAAEWLARDTIHLLGTTHRGDVAKTEA